MAQIQVTASQLSDSQAQLKNFNSELKSAIEEADNMVRQLKNDWEGDASDAFQASYTSNSQRLMRATEGIQSFITALENIIAQYKQTEAANVNIANSMK